MVCSWNYVFTAVALEGIKAFYAVGIMVILAEGFGAAVVLTNAPVVAFVVNEGVCIMLLCRYCLSTTKGARNRCCAVAVILAWYMVKAVKATVEMVLSIAKIAVTALIFTLPVMSLGCANNLTAAPA